MPELAASAAIESEIRELLLEGKDSHAVARTLLRKYEILDLPLPQFSVVGTFLRTAGLNKLFCELCLKKLELEARIPWDSFIASLMTLSSQLPEPVVSAILNGAEAQGGLDELARSERFLSLAPQLAPRKKARREAQQEKYKNMKQELLAQLDMFRSQELDEEEERLMQHLLGLFPMDQEIVAKSVELRNRKAVRLLDQKVGTSSEDGAPEAPLLSPEEKKALDIIVKSMKRTWKKFHNDKILAHDFAIALLMWDYPEASLQFLEGPGLTDRARWTRFEALLMSRQFVTLLNELELMSLRGSQDPEETFAILYLKAHALWGLSHRMEAIEILESIVSHRPSYRSALTLLRVWKGGLG